MRLLLDTHICIYLIKKKPPEVLQRFNAFIPGNIGISSITAAELHYGSQKSQRPLQNQQALAQFLLPLSVAEFDEAAAVAYGSIRANLERQGTPIGALDLLIAAQAVSLNIPLVTNNTNDFARIPELQLENWVNE